MRSHGTNRSLFIHWDEDFCDLSEAIRHVYCQTGWQHEGVQANHWGVAASWAEIVRVLDLEICRAATSLSSCTFTKHYHLDHAKRPVGSHVFYMVTEGRPRQKNAKTPFASLVCFLLAFAVSFGLGGSVSNGYPRGILFLRLMGC